MRRPLFILLAFLALAVPATVGRPAAAPEPGAELRASYRRPTAIPFPPDNPYSDAKATLGRALFFDPRVSGAGNIACATCHNPGLGWSDGLPVGIGAGGAKLARHSPSIVDAAWREALAWDGRFDTLEHQAAGPIEAPTEMNQSMAVLARKLAAMPGYRRLFDAAFPEEAIDGTAITRALATFERTVVSGPAPFDRWIAGDDTAIDDAAKRGFALFNGKGHCAACHSGWRFTDDSFHDVGLPGADIGRGKIMLTIPIMQHAFKTPSLRNVAQRAPYMHDGSIATLGAVMRHYVDGFIQRPSLSPEMRRVPLSEQECHDIVSFMLTLSSRDAPVSVPTLPTEESR